MASCWRISANGRSRPKADSAHSLNTMTPVQITNEKYSSFVFSEFMIIYCHPASCRGRTRDRHDT